MLAVACRPLDDEDDELDNKNDEHEESEGSPPRPLALRLRDHAEVARRDELER